MWEARFLSTSLLGLAILAGPAVISAQRGEALYNGKEPLQGKIRGHDDLLPPETVQCSNCHSAKSTSRLSEKPAPQLNRAWLLDLRQRHGGPPSNYNQVSFCRLLRKGIDPAYVLIAREMPSYELDDTQCASLWNFLSETGASNESR